MEVINSIIEHIIVSFILCDIPCCYKLSKHVSTIVVVTKITDEFTVVCLYKGVIISNNKQFILNGIKNYLLKIMYLLFESYGSVVH